MTILVTGASGEIGKALVPQLLKADEIRVFGRRNPGFSKDVEFIKGDLRDFNSLLSACADIDTVVHLGAVTAGQEHVLTLDTDVKGTYNLMEAAAQNKVKKVVFASSIAAIGVLCEDFIPEYLPVDEEHPCKPKDIYGLSKFLGEEILKSYTRMTGITTIALRITAVRDFKTSGSSLQAPKVTLWSLIDIRDAVQAIQMALKSNITGNEVFNIGPCEIGTEENAFELTKIHYPQVRLLPDAEYFVENPREGLFQISKAQQLLGFSPEHELSDNR